MIEITNILDVENYINDIDVVIFDLDDTLYSEIDYVRSGFKEIVNNYSYIDNLYEKLLDAFKKGYKVIDYVSNQLNLEKEKDNWLNLYRNHIPDIYLYDGVEEMLKKIRQTKRIGIITDGRPIGQHNKIESLGLEKLVDDIIITDELGGIEYRKPCSKAFELLKEKYNVPYNKMIYIGDNINKDFIAPIKLGMNYIYFKNKEGLYVK